MKVLPSSVTEASEGWESQHSGLTLLGQLNSNHILNESYYEHAKRSQVERN